MQFTNRVLLKYYQSEDNWIDITSGWIDEIDEEILNNGGHLNDLEFIRNGRILRLSNMSSGEKMLLLRAISVLNSIEENSVIIVEEPELHLDQVWNRQLTTFFQVLFSNYNSHLIIATHDYSIINSVIINNLIVLNNGEVKPILGNTFLASYDELFRTIYGEKFKINKIEDDFLKSISQKNVDQLKIDFEELGNSFYKYLVFKQIKKLS